MSKTLKYILFDLDETLYPTRSGLMARIGQLMGRYMEERLDMPPGEVPSLRRYYYRTYGTTMRGLQIHHGIDPEDYLAYVHDIPLEDYIYNENRYNILRHTIPDEAAKLLKEAQEDVNRRWKNYEHMASLTYDENK